MNVPPELVARAQSGDTAALEDLVSSVQADVWRLLLSRMGPGPDAEDAFQETFRQAIESLGRLRNPRAFAAWLFRIALNKSRTFRNPPGPDAARASNFMEEAGMAMQKEETRAQVRRAVAGLEEDLRTTVELRYEHGLGYAEIAEAMEVPEGTVSWRLSRAHERLKQALTGAGVALTLAALEGELAAAPVVAVPGAAAARVGRLVRQRPRPSAARWKKRVGAVGGAVSVLLVALWISSRPGNQDETAQRPAGTVAGTALSAAMDAPRQPAIDEPPANVKKDTAAVAPPVAADRARVRGRVTDRETGGPVAGARIELLRLGPPEEKAGETLSAADGSYSFEVAPGAYVLNSSHAGYVSARFENLFLSLWGAMNPENLEEVKRDRIDVTLAAGDAAVRDFTLRAGATLHGRVVDTRGFPIDGVRITAGSLRVEEKDSQLNLDAGAFGGVDAVTDARGEFTLGGLMTRGTLTVSAERSGFRPVFLDVSLPPAREPIELVLNTGLTLRATVRNALGQPLHGVRFFAPADLTAGYAEKPLAGSTDEAGVFEDASGSVTSGLLLAWKEGYGPALVSMEGADPAGLELRLSPATDRLEGRVVDASGVPQSGVQVVVAELGVKAGESEATISLKSPAGPRLLDVKRPGVLLDVPGVSSTTAEDGSFLLDGICLGAGCRVVVAIYREGLLLHHQSIEKPGRIDLVLPAE